MLLDKQFSPHFSALVEPSDRILVAVSGGLDSVVLLALLKKHALNDLAIVHCNFQLRGKDSNADEAFVKQLAKQYGLPIFSKRFDTKTEQKKPKQSTQMIARNLRYDYFSEILSSENYDYVAVAHHADDQIETFFINLLRGSGVKGLRGMLPKREQIIRPLLKFSRQNLEHFAKKNNLEYREDTTNSDDYYLRNNIRHNLLPCLEQLGHSAKANILQSMENLQDLETQSLQDLETLQKCGFSATQIRSIQKAGHSGKQFLSKTHRAITHNGKLLIEPIFNADCRGEPTCSPSPTIVKNANKGRMQCAPTVTINLIDIEKFVLNTAPTIAQLDYDKLQFPLTLRRWENGDFFIPFGQRGKQKLSDFFINQKLSRFEKERVWLLCSGNDIAWVIGHRIDNRFRISAKTKRVLMVEI